MDWVEVQPKRGLATSDCVFYHSVELPLSGPQTGAWDLLGRFDEYIGHQDLGGKTVLDVGTASGFLSFEAERRGARVSSFDVASAGLYKELPFPGNDFVANHSAWRARLDAFLDGMRNSYWLGHEEFGSAARCFYGDVYDLDDARYDVVILGQILVHLRDGLSALAAAARVCEDTLVVVEGNLVQADSPIAALCGRADRPDLPYAWYHYSHGWYREVMTMLGFPSVTITTGLYTCNDPSPREIELATVVARRAAPNAQQLRTRASRRPAWLRAATARAGAQSGR